MPVQIDLSSLLLTAFIAVLAPLLCELPLSLKLPMVVLELGLGILIGPQVLAWAKPGAFLNLLGFLGLIFLFFLAGMELDLRAVRGAPLAKASKGWLLSLAVAFAGSGVLHHVGFIRNWLLVAAILTTTTLGTLLPILRDSGDLETKFGSYVMAAAITGELGPIILVSVLFSRHHTELAQTLFMVTFVGIALGAAALALLHSPPLLVGLVARTMDAASQLPVRIAILVLMMLVALATRFGLDMILGAFASGMVVGLGSRGQQGHSLRHKLDAIGFGFLIPIFFVTSGMQFDLHALFDSPKAMLRLPAFLLLFLVVRGAPVIFYRGVLHRRERTALALYSATTLPLVIALTHLGVQTGQMFTDNAAALVGAGMLSTLMFPVVAMSIRGSVLAEEVAAEEAERYDRAS
jgi:Kef-type K+ transport system membrane component KefB